MSPEEVREFRRSEGLTQAQLAAKLRLKHKDTLRAWEAGKTPVSGPASLAMRMIAKLREGGKGITNAVIEGLWNGA